MDLINFFNPKILFDITVGPWLEYGFFVFVASISIFAIGVILKIVQTLAPVSEIYSRLMVKTSSMLMVLGGFAVFFWFSRQQRVPIFSARFWWVFWLISAVIWIIFIIKNIIKFKENREDYMEKKKLYTDYLPKKKK